MTRTVSRLDDFLSQICEIGSTGSVFHDFMNYV